MKIAFVDDRYEGKQTWVSPARLEVEWSGVTEHAAKSARWTALNDAPDPSEDEAGAAFAVWSSTPLRNPDFFEFEHKGIALIRDLERLCELLGLAPDALILDPLSIEDEQGLHVPWATTEQIVRNAAPRFRDDVLRYIEKEERDAERKSVVGYDFRWTRNDPLVHVSGERVARHYEERVAPVHRLIRAWLGEDVSRERQEILGLQRELSRVGEIAMSAISQLKQLRSNRTADKLLEQLLNPPSRWQGYGADDARVEQPMAKYRWVPVATDQEGNLD